MHVNINTKQFFRLDVGIYSSDTKYLSHGAWTSILDCAYDYLNFKPGGNRHAFIAIIQHIISLDPKHMSSRDQEFLSKHPIFAFDPVE